MRSKLERGEAIMWIWEAVASDFNFGLEMVGKIDDAGIVRRAVHRNQVHFFNSISKCANLNRQ